MRVCWTALLQTVVIKGRVPHVRMMFCTHRPLGLSDSSINERIERMEWQLLGNIEMMDRMDDEFSLLNEVSRWERKWKVGRRSVCYTDKH